MKYFAGLPLGVRLSLVQAITTIIIMGIFTGAVSTLITKRLEHRAEKELEQQVLLVVNSMSVYNSAITESVGKLMALFRGSFPGQFSRDSSREVTVGETSTPILKSGAITLNLNTAIVDGFSEITKTTATIFIRSGDDFVRVATSLKKGDGSRAIGTILDRGNPAYVGLLRIGGD